MPGVTRPDQACYLAVKDARQVTGHHSESNPRIETRPYFLLNFDSRLGLRVIVALTRTMKPTPQEKDAIS